ncbi:hypothetical protein [Alteribacillus bidgolensis]|uniref:hypothetical protein n=1 Tax=Alteribacillus bidgolensis TaxID=930129 RepID=UPI00111433C5|nr:hypothetical protein [Alteribacillus bidgolensis]
MMSQRLFIHFIFRKHAIQFSNSQNGLAKHPYSRGFIKSWCCFNIFRPFSSTTSPGESEVQSNSLITLMMAGFFSTFQQMAYFKFKREIAAFVTSQFPSIQPVSSSPDTQTLDYLLQSRKGK